MLTLSYGFKKMESSDTGDVFFPALASNAQLMNDHTHNGTNSAPLATRSVNALSAGWVEQSAGVYRQLVTCPSGLTYDQCQIWVKKSTGEYVYPTIERVSSTTFYVYTDNNTLSYVCYFR